MTPEPTHEPVRLPDPIHRPELQSRTRRGLFALLSLLGWMCWLYLLAPLASLLGWAFGYHRFQVYVLHGSHRVGFTLVVYAAVIAFAGLMLVVWAFYNLLRFGSKDRRSAAEPVSEAALAQGFGLNREQLSRLHHGRVMRLYHDDHGHIVDVEQLAPRRARDDDDDDMAVGTAESVED